MRLIYTANARIPSEKAHTYQILQMCEAFAQAGGEVCLVHAWRHNPPALRTDDVWAFYGLTRTFGRRVIPCLDIFPLGEYFPSGMRAAWWRLAALLQTLTYNIMLVIRMALTDWSDALVYSRDPLTLVTLATLWPRRRYQLYLEAHAFPITHIGLRLRRWLVRRLGGVIVVTEHLAHRYHSLGVREERLLVARDGFREGRFAIEGDQREWRDKLGWPPEAFIVGFVGRFHLMGMEKGLTTLTDAVAKLAHDDPGQLCRLALVGGPAEIVNDLRSRLTSYGLSPEIILYPGHVPPDQVPGYLRALDVCVLPSPWTEFFAYYISPLKLFEYMAAAKPIVATNLPAIAEVIAHERNGLLVPPGDADALADALRQLRDDPSLRTRLATQAATDSQAYTWAERAQRILKFVGENGCC